MQLTLSRDVAVQVIKYWLSRYRKMADVSQTDAAKEVGTKQSTIAGYEMGKHVPSQLHLRALLDFYGRSEQFAELSAMRDVAARRGVRTEGVPVGMVESIGLRFGLESFALSIEEYRIDVVSGLLQTEDYAREIITTYADLMPVSDAERTLQTRMDRQEVLRRDGGETPLELMMYVEEQVLRRPIGGPGVQGKQLDHLLDISQEKNITVRVVPQAVGFHAALKSSLSLMSFGDERRVAYAEDFQSAHYYDSPAGLETAARLMSHLHHVALDQSQSRRLISEIRKESAST